MSQISPEGHDQTWTSDEVRVTAHHKPGCKVELQVAASSLLVAQAKKAAVKAVKKEVILPGFRKGKAPEDVILKKYPHDVEEKYHTELANLTFAAAQKLSGIPLLNNNAQIAFELKNQTEQTAELYFSFETEPKIPKVDPSLFQPKPIERPVVGNIQIEEAIRQMQFFYAKWTNVVDRPIRDGDYILISVDTWENEQPQRVFHHVRFEVSKERMANWMRALVQGAKAGDVLEGMSEPDEESTAEEKQIFQPKKVRLTLHKVEEAELPELNDEFAKKVGSTDVAAMRNFIEKLLNEKAEEKVKEELCNQVNAFFISNYSFDLPDSLVDTEKQDRIQQLQHNPKMKKRWDAMTLEERQSAENTIKEESSHAISLFYLSRQVVHDAQIPVSQTEIQKEAIQTLSSIKGSSAEQIEAIPKEIYALAFSKVLLAKAQAYTIQHAQNA